MTSSSGPFELLEQVWTNCRLWPGSGEPLESGAIWARAGQIHWVGPASELDPAAAEVAVDLGGAWVTPGLVDCHTHLVFGGHRAVEFEARLQGASYAEIAGAGGGIRSTVTATRSASPESLFQGARSRVIEMLRQGVTTVEIKSGYGLNLETELEMLRVGRRLAREAPVRVRTTLLAAHAVPTEFEGRPEAYLDLVCERLLPAVAAEKLADAVDAFGEKIAFSPEQVRRVFERARALELPVKLHADQLSDQGGAALAAEFGALSADHLEYTSPAGVEALARSGTVAVLLPGAFYALGETRKPPVAAFRRAGVPMAVATDCNPGSSPMTSLPLAMNMACTLFGLTPREALEGATSVAARALGTPAGRLEPEHHADFVVWDIDDLTEIPYWIGRAPIRDVVACGRSVLPWLEEVSS